MAWSAGQGQLAAGDLAAVPANAARDARLGAVLDSPTRAGVRRPRCVVSVRRIRSRAASPAMMRLRAAAPAGVGQPAQRRNQRRHRSAGGHQTLSQAVRSNGGSAILAQSTGATRQRTVPVFARGSECDTLRPPPRPDRSRQRHQRRHHAQRPLRGRLRQREVAVEHPRRNPTPTTGPSQSSSANVNSKVLNVVRFGGPNGIRTRATSLKGWRPGPLDDRATA